MSDADDARTQARALWRRLADRPDDDVIARMRAHGFWPVDAPVPPSVSPSGAARDRPRRQPPAAAREPGAAPLHLGDGVSDRLGEVGSDVARLARQRLPLVHDAAGLAAAMGLSLGSLKWLTYHRRTAALVHYHRYDVPKRPRGVRHISAPKARLKAAQRWVLAHVLEPLAVDDHAHGFCAGQSVVTNARPHVKRAVVVNLDLTDFFPSISFGRVRGLFVSLGYGRQVATVLALLCTEPPRQPIRLDGDSAARVQWVALGERALPQGAPTSPSLTNLLCRRLDKRLAGMARAQGLSYTRYADDLTFSGDAELDVGVLLARVRAVLVDEGFTENPEKTRVMRKGRRQEVTGVVVNDRPTVARTEVRRLRAILHNAARSGLQSQNRDNHPAFARHLAGKIAWVHMVDPARGVVLARALQRVLSGPVAGGAG